MYRDKDVLILVPKETALGGATTYYRNILHLFSLRVTYLGRGNKKYPFKENRFSIFIRLIYDLVRFLLLCGNHKIVHINTSLRTRSLLRDSVYILVKELFKNKLVITFHAWSELLEDIVSRKYLKLFKFFLCKADTVIVLSNDFRKKLIEWGFKKPIYVETTIVDKKFLDNFDENTLHTKYAALKAYINILFLARIEKTKGIYEAIQTYELLKSKNTDIKMTIVGDGLELEDVKRFVKKRKLTDIDFTGYLHGSDLIQVYRNADIYFFPSYTEGMPTSVLEAMTFGLPIISRSVGGLKDFFIDDKMGYLTKSFEPEEFARLFIPLLKSSEKRKEIALFNYNYAKQHFISDVVVKRLEKIYQQTINS